MTKRTKVSQLVVGIALVSVGGTGISFAQTNYRAGSSTPVNAVSEADRTLAMKCISDKYRTANTPQCKANNSRIAAILKTAQASGVGSGGVATAAPPYIKLR